MRISVIVPIYNVDKYLLNCIKSILYQDFDDFELILVNDGSLDDSSHISDFSIINDSRIVVISKINGGLVSARKAGALIATGDYIVCIDGDDTVENGYFSNIISNVNNNDLDTICYGFNEIGINYKTIKYNDASEGLYLGKELDILRSNFLFNHAMYGLNSGLIHNSLVAKVVKREIYMLAQLKVPNHIILGEDMICSYWVLYYSNSLKVLLNSYYNYNNYTISIMRSISTEKVRLINDTLIELYCISSDVQASASFTIQSVIGYLYKAAVSSNNYSSFKKYTSIISNFPLIYLAVNSFDIKKCSFADILKVLIVKYKLYLLYYLLSVLKIKFTEYRSCRL